MARVVGMEVWGAADGVMKAVSMSWGVVVVVMGRPSDDEASARIGRARGSCLSRAADLPPFAGRARERQRAVSRPVDTHSPGSRHGLAQGLARWFLRSRGTRRLEGLDQRSVER